MSPTNHLGASTPWNIIEIDQTGSTNTDLLERAADLPHRTVLRADHQTAGRGRLDRKWDAPPGANLLMSILFHRVDDDPTALMRSLGVGAVTGIRTLDPKLGRDIGLKWPNDILLRGNKLAGMLAQQPEPGTVVIGLGLNVGWAPEGAAKLGGTHTPTEVMQAILAGFDAVTDNPTALLDRYRSELFTLGQQVRVELPGKTVTGYADCITDGGALEVVDEAGVRRAFHMGDVVHLRVADA